MKSNTFFLGAALACTLAPLSSAQIGNVDQTSTRGTIGINYHSGKGNVFQQQVTAGRSGILTGVEIWIGGNLGSDTALRVRNGPVPSSQPVLWEGIAFSDGSLQGWEIKLLDTSAAGIALVAGQAFTLEFELLGEYSGVAGSDCTPPCYPDPMVAPYPVGRENRLAFRTFLSDAAPGVNYCVPSTYTNGGLARIWAFGSTSIAANDLELHAGGMPDVAALFFYGTQPTQIPFGGGFLCVTGNLTRLPGMKPHCGKIASSFDLSQVSPSLVVAGTTLHAQAWFRDPYQGYTHSLSDAYAFTLTP